MEEILIFKFPSFSLKFVKKIYILSILHKNMTYL